MKLFFALAFASFLSNSFADISVKDINLMSKVQESTLTIKYEGKLLDYPDFKLEGMTLEITLPKASLKNNALVSTQDKNILLNANNDNKKQVLIKLDLPYDLKGKEELIAMSVLDGKIDLSFPKLALKADTKERTVKTSEVSPVKVETQVKENLDKAYLENLLALEENSKKIETKLEDKMFEPKKDEVKTIQAQIEKKEEPITTNNAFSIASYAGKFVGFLAVILLFFYGLMMLMKKGVIKKGRLGFLHNADNVMVLSTTHIGPKKSLMLIKAHKQVFLVSNTEQGMQLISEVKDGAGLFKDTEKSVSGTNFDINLDDVSDVDLGNIKLKEDITKSNENATLSSFLDVKDKVKFSDEIKKKVKNLKPLQ